MNHTQLLNHLIKKHDLNSYLEIGVQNPANNFDKINCDIKIGVDPECYGKNIFKMLSDDYFNLVFNSNKPLGKDRARTYSMHDKFDLIFIDGLHHSDQVQRDFENSLKCLNDNGFIVIHDCLPVDESTTHVPRDSKVWHGDVYKFCMRLNTYPDIGFVTYDFDNGCCVVWKILGKKPVENNYPADWKTFKEVGQVLLNVVDENNL